MERDGHLFLYQREIQRGGGRGYWSQCSANMPLVSQQECKKKSVSARILSFKNDFDVVTNMDYGVTSSLSWLSFFICESRVGSIRI